MPDAPNLNLPKFERQPRHVAMSISLPEDMVKQIDSIAEKEDLPRSKIIAALLKAILENA